MSRDLKVAILDGDKLHIFAMCTATNQLYEVYVDHKAWKAWSQGTKLQDAFPNLSPSQREFLRSGLTPAEWNNIYGAET